MVTLKQLAKELGVSISTVSKALNDSFEISEETKEKILALAKKYNYRPNNVAVNLRTRSTQTLGVIIPNIFNHFYTKILSGIEQEAKKNNYKIIISISNETLDSEREGISFFSNGSVDGILLAPSEETEKVNDYEHITDLHAKEIPFVLFDRYSDKVASDRVIINDFDSAKKTITYLTNLGKKNIVAVSLIKNLSVGRLRRKGVQEASSNVTILEFEDEKEFEEVFFQFLKTEKVDAIFALDELAGIIALNLARTLSLNIPKDVSIISFSQGILSEYSYPKLSTINQHAEEIGKKSVELILSRLKNKNKPTETKIINTALDLHQTT
ncbi:LacI family DNA-binding transcriptional regulator [Tenacibaculum tangerinum]|uniref:LacI family DNA-binding transcriptional regulator n=1 Tax=Tenacibaculum tangerinum TaxID=3038772 RepID=A0ABY8L604_9FLAO|nr:LacI family DNA-binding transcriptional regulator [Tenacibaculum tangerinum]WGH76052.1 LacI family DNA-binding transcriptional regulator [Tenacibaculum tangerinum]